MAIFAGNFKNKKLIARPYSYLLSPTITVGILRHTCKGPRVSVITPYAHWMTALELRIWSSCLKEAASLHAQCMFDWCL